MSDAIAEADREYWLHLEFVLNSVIDELKNTDKIRTHYTQNDKTRLGLLINTMFSIGYNFGALNKMNMFIKDENEKAKDFLKNMNDFGFDAPALFNLNIQIAVLSAVAHTEIAKTYFLFHLKNVESYKASDFNRVMKNNIQKNWKHLKPYIENDFRNSLAHGTWAIKDRNVILFRDAKLEPYLTLNLADFIGKIKSQNIFYACTVDTITQRLKVEIPHYFESYIKAGNDFLS